MPITSEQIAWTERFTGISLARPAMSTRSAATTGGTARVADTLALWREAKDSIDTQIGAMQTALRGTGDPTAVDLAEKGLAGVTRNLAARLIASLMDFDRSADAERDKAAARLRAALKPLKGQIAADPLLATLEQNPFGIAVTIRATLAETFGRIEQQL